MREVWEGIARNITEETGVSAPVDALELAAMCGIDATPWAYAHGSLDGSRMRFPATVPGWRSQAITAHELGHWALQWANEPDSEEGAIFIGDALMLPRREFDRDLRRTWRIDELQAKHLNCNAAMIARRIVSMRDAVATIFENGRVLKRLASPWMPDPLKRLTRWERGLIDQALEAGEAVQGDTLVWAVPVFTPGFRRVVLVAEMQQLTLRL